MKITNLSKTYHNKSGDVLALDSVDLNVESNGMTFILGPSGSGKSTLLAIIAGRIRDYSGEVVLDGSLYYLTQEIELIPYFSIVQNLSLISNDKDKIRDLIKKYNLEEVKNKKVRYLSLGQKKRVQFIKIELLNPDIILCDEVTAALDFDNATIVMNTLKDLSKDRIVIFVTHDLNLAHDYADCIIKIESAKIIDDQIIHNTSTHTLNISQKKISFSYYLRYLFYKLTSRPLHNLVSLLLIILSFFIIYTSINLFSHTLGQNEYLDSFRFAQNVIVSKSKAYDDKMMDEYMHYLVDQNEIQPNRHSKLNSETLEYFNIDQALYDQMDYDEKLAYINGDFNAYSKKEFKRSFSYDYFFPEFDTYSIKDIKEIINSSSDIMAYESFFTNQYLSLTLDQDVSKLRDLDEKIYTKSVYTTYFADDTEIEISYINRPMSKPFFPKYIFDNIANDYVIDPSYVNDLSRDVAIYSMVEDHELPLLYGSMPKNPDEIVLDYNLSHLYCLTFTDKKIDDLIGEEITLSVEYINEDRSTDSYQDVNDNTRTSAVKEKNFTYTISGVSKVESEYERQAFIAGDFEDSQIIDFFIEDKNLVEFEYLNLLVEPGSDLDGLISDLNKQFIGHYTSFASYEQSAKEANAAIYKDPASFSLLALLASVVIALISVIFITTDHKNLHLERKVLVSYGYGYFKYQLIKVVGLFISLMIIIFVLLPPFIDFINSLAINYNYVSFMSFSLVLSLILLTVILVLEHLLKYILSKI